MAILSLSLCCFISVTSTSALVPTVAKGQIHKPASNLPPEISRQFVAQISMQDGDNAGGHKYKPNPHQGKYRKPRLSEYMPQRSYSAPSSPEDSTFLERGTSDPLAYLDKLSYQRRESDPSGYDYMPSSDQTRDPSSYYYQPPSYQRASNDPSGYMPISSEMGSSYDYVQDPAPRAKPNAYVQLFIPSPRVRPKDLPRYPARVGRLMDAWLKTCDSISADAMLTVEDRLDKHERVMLSKGVLRQMDHDLIQAEQEKRPDHLFGLAFGKFPSFSLPWSEQAAEAQDIRALATVKLERALDVNGTLSEIARKQDIVLTGFAWPWEAEKKIEVAHITELVAKPSEILTGVGGELFHAIVDWAKLKGKLVTVQAQTEELMEYYRTIGFESISGNSSRLVYCRGLKAGTEHPETPSRPTSDGHLLDLLERDGPQVTNIMDAWVRSCDIIAAEALRPEPERYQHYQRALSSLGALQGMYEDLREIAPENRPDHLFGFVLGQQSSFALPWTDKAAKESIDQFEALASLQLGSVPDVDVNQNERLSDVARYQGIELKGFMMPWADRKRVDVAHLSRLVAKPNESRVGVGDELFHAIIRWAKLQGRLVTVLAETEQARQYYRKLGFESVWGLGSRMVYCRDNRADNVKSEDKDGYMLDLLD